VTRKRSYREWRKPASILEATTPLAIDREVQAAHKKSRLAPHWKLTDARQFGRRALIVAIEDAQTYDSHRLSKARAHQSRTIALARVTRARLSIFLRHLDDANKPLPQRIPRSWGGSGRVYVRVTSERLLSEGLREALIAARDVCGEVEKLKVGIGKDGSEGEPGKRAFVFRLAEAWTYLTGRPPGPQTEAARNPFFRFVVAAWRDVGLADDENFVRALQTALAQLNSNKQALAKLIEHGPMWR
jgi:hypothetical protein